MSEQDPAAHIEVIVEAPYENREVLGSLALKSYALLDGIDVDEVISGMELILAIQEDIPSLEIKEEQVDCLDALQEARSRGDERVLIQMATGLGKTTVAAADAKRFLAENPGARVLFLSHQNRISDQARERFESILGDEYTYSNFNGEDPEGANTTCVFASFQAMANWREAFREDEFDYIVIDEAHHSKANTYEPTVQYFTPKFMLAMTATPDRHDMRDIRDLFGDEIYKLTLEEAIAQGLLAYVDYHVIIDDLAANNLLRDPETRRKLNMKQLNRTIFIPKRDEEIADICRQKQTEIGEPVRRLVFCKSVEQSEEMAQYYEKAAPIHSKMPPWEIKQTLERYKAGELETLLTVDMFNEGIDVPEVNQVVFLRLTESTTVFLQQLGRGLRKLGDKTQVQVLDFVASCDRLAMLDAFWKRIVAHSKQGDNPGEELMRLNFGELHFTDEVRDILEVLSDINNTLQFETQPAPDEYVTIQQIAESSGYSAARLARIVRDLEIEPATFGHPVSGKPVQFFSPTQVGQLLTHPHLQLKPVPKGMVNKNQAKDQLGVSFKQLTKLLTEIGIEPTLYLSPVNYPASYLAQEDLDRVREYLDSKYPLPPDDYQPYLQLADEHGINEDTMNRLVSELGIGLPMYRSKKGGNIRFISGDDAERLLSHPFLALEPAPEGYLSVPDLEDVLGVSDSTVLKLVEDLGIEWSRYKNARNYETRYLSPEQADLLIGHEHFDAESAPDGWISQSQLAGELGTVWSTVANIASDLDIEPQTKRNSKGVATVYYSPDQIDLIRSHQRITTAEAPEGDMTSSDLEATYGFHHRKVMQVIEGLGIKGKAYKHTKTKRIHMFYSPEQVSTIVAHINSQ